MTRFADKWKRVQDRIQSIPAEELGLPNTNPPVVVDQDNLTLLEFDVGTDRIMVKIPIPYDFAAGPIELNVVWTNDGGVDDLGKNVRWQFDYQSSACGLPVNGSHANSPKTIQQSYSSAAGWIEHHTPFIKIPYSVFEGRECLFVKIMPVAADAPALSCKPRMIGICSRYSKHRHVD